MGVSQWFEDRRADSVSHGLSGRVAYTVIVVLVGAKIFSMTSFFGPWFAGLITGFVAIFGGVPFLVKVWAPSATARKRELAQRLRIDPEPPPREVKAPKRW